ncbi:MAG: hypothetical protein OXS40_08005 [Gammaproteobacteria bacterium]|nr:hypothetical protein [Gammaproteobacteria bacterium]
MGPGIVAVTLGLTAAEVQVAMLLAQNRSERGIIATTDRRKSTVRWA